MRVLVTGASGLLGAEVVERFRAAGLEVVGTMRTPSPPLAPPLPRRGRGGDAGSPSPTLWERGLGGEGSTAHASDPLSARGEGRTPTAHDSPSPFTERGLGGEGSLDITQPDAVRAVFDALHPKIVIHCAAMTNVDACEHQPQQAYRVNAFGAEVIASNCQRIGAICVYISTDYVFDGSKRAPYHEYDAENPLSVYGRSKFAGEQAVRTLCPRHYIARVAWLYGKQRKSFPQFVLEQARAGKSPTVISDQIGSPTYAADVADRLLQLIQTDCYGTYHLTNTEPVSRYEFARALLQAAGLEIEPTPIPFAQWRTPAPRPAYSALISWRLEWAGVEPMPPWKDAMRRFLQGISIAGTI